MSEQIRNFIDANKGLIDVITRNASKLLHESPESKVVHCDGATEDIVITQSASTTEDLLWLYEDQPIDIATANASKDAAEANRLSIIECRLSLLGGLSLASMFYEASQQAEPNNNEGPRLLKYKTAEYRSSQGLLIPTETDLYMSQLNIYGLEFYETAQLLSMKLVDQLGISRDLKINKLGDETVGVSLNTEIDNDPLLNRCLELFDGKPGKVLMLIAGTHDTDEQLDEAISEIWMDYLGTSKEEEVSLVLEEVRARAIATKHARTFHIEHSANMPSHEQLEEFADVISLEWD